VDALAENPFPLYVLLCVIAVLLPTKRARALAGTGLGLSALGMAANTVGGTGSGTFFATTNEILIGLGALVVIAAGVLAWRSKTAGPPATRSAELEPVAPPDLLLLLGLLLSAAGPHLLLIAAGSFLVLLSAARVSLLARRTGWLAVVGSAAVILGWAMVMLFTILGSHGGLMTRLGSGPFSPAAERLLVLLIGLAAFVLAGLPPLHRPPWGLSLAPFGAILIARILAAALPGGLGDWESAAMLWLAAAVIYGAVIRRWPLVLVAGGLMSLWSGLTSAIFPGCVLVLWGWLTGAGLLTAGRLGALARERWSGLLALAPALAAPFGLAAAMSREVLLTVLAAAAVMIVLALDAGRRPRPA
jgi:hypothetical protein